MPTIADQPITSGTVRLVERGDWFADVTTNSSERIGDGARVILELENVRLSGAVIRGGISEGIGRYQLAGRPEWSRTIKPRAYQSSVNVLRKTVLADLCRDVLGAGWASLVSLPSDTSFGTHYERRGTFGDAIVLARDVLESLGLPWYIDNAGITVFANRPSGEAVTEARIIVLRRNDAIGYRVLACDDLAAFVPGLTFEGETIGDVSLVIKPDDIDIHLWTRAAANAFDNLLRAAWRRMFPRIELQGIFSYTTVGPSSSGKHDLRATQSRQLPDIRACNGWSLAGSTVRLVPGSRVIVAFVDGDPVRPVILGADPSSPPIDVEFGASGTISADAIAIDLGDAVAPVVRIGDTVQIGTTAGPIIFVTGLPPNPLLPSKVKA